MNDEQHQEEKRAFQKLLREYQGNIGMASLVCGKPVELMPEAEQNRLIQGFFTPTNLAVLRGSHQKLSNSKREQLDQEELAKLDLALIHLEQLIKNFTAFVQKRIDIAALRKNVQALVEKGLPENREQLAEALSRNIEKIHFLSEQQLASKDSWDCMIDCVQMHDALSRTFQICKRLQEQELATGSSISATAALVEQSLASMEYYFRHEQSADKAQHCFNELGEGLRNLWAKS